MKAAMSKKAKELIKDSDTATKIAEAMATEQKTIIIKDKTIEIKRI